MSILGKNLEEQERALYEKYSEIKRFVKRAGVLPDDIEDVVQDIFVAAGSHLHQLREREKLTAWLYTIARRQVAAYWKKRGSRREVNLDACEAELDNLYYNTKVSQEKNLLTDDGELFRLIEGFRDPIPQILEMRFYRGYRLKEVAEYLQMNYNSVRTLEHRAIKKLRQMLLEEQEKE